MSGYSKENHPMNHIINVEIARQGRIPNDELLISLALPPLNMNAPSRRNPYEHTH